MLAESADEASKQEIYDVFQNTLANEGQDPLDGMGLRKKLVLNQPSLQQGF